MTICPADPAAMQTAPQRHGPGLVLVGLGEAGLSGLGGLPDLDQAAAQLAALLAMPLQQLTPMANPGRALAALHPHSSDQRSWLAALPLDVGRPLDSGGCWADHLGAWAQPCLLVVSAPQLESGLPKAGVALLRLLKIPLVGVVQQGGCWDPAARRADGMPWLGWLPALEPVAEDSNALAQAEAMAEMVGTALLNRWHRIGAQAAVAAPQA